MPTRHPRLRRLPVAAVAALGLLAGCGGSATVATVNGEAIDQDDVVAMRVTYEDSATAPGDSFRDDLSGLIIERAMLQAARDDFDIEITSGDIDDRVAEPPARYAPMFDQMAADPTIGEGMVRANAVRSLIRDGVLARLVIDAYGSTERVISEAPQDVVQVCARHILLQTEEEALDVIARLDAGEDFDDLVTEVSMDTASPGGLLAGPEGCPLHLTPLGADFARTAATTPEGEVGGPIATEFGYHVIYVEERLEPTAEELEADFASYYDPNAGGSFFSGWFNDVVRDADIDVASNIGTWSETALGIVPPGGFRSEIPGPDAFPIDGEP